MIYDPINTVEESADLHTGSSIKIAIRLRIHPPKRRNPRQRLHARLYYRRNRARIRMQRRRYLRIHRSIIKHRKMFMRFKPSWFKKTKKPSHHLLKVSVPKSKIHKQFQFKPKSPWKMPAPKKRH